MLRLWLVLGGLIAAQAAQAQTVQLPTYSMTGVSTTVLVPDRGMTSLGGISRAASGGSSFGGPFLPGNRAGGANVGASQFGVTVQIHDMAELDKAVLDEAARRQAAKGVAAAAPTPLKGLDLSGPLSLAEIAKRKAAQESLAAGEAERLFAQAKAAEAAGKTGVAKVYYQMAARRAASPLKEQALAAYQRLQAAGATAAR